MADEAKQAPRPTEHGAAEVAAGAAADRRRPTERDQRIVAKQIGRQPRPFLEVTRRCRYDFPQVILTAPLQRRNGRWDVFPTVFWLTCPLLHRAIGRLEAAGAVREYEERLVRDAELGAAMEAAHEAAAAHRLKLVPEQERLELERERPREARVLAETGVAGMRGRSGVKCLHAHFADFLGRGDNPIGADVLRRVLDAGVPLDGTDQCWKFCALAGSQQGRDRG